MPSHRVRIAAAFRSLLLFALSVSLLIAVSPAVSQDEPVEPPAEAPPREWATLDVVAAPPSAIPADLETSYALPVTVTNNGNIAALNVIVAVEGSRAFEASPVLLGDIEPGSSAAATVPVLVKGRRARAEPFLVRATADNVSGTTVAGAEQSFAALSPTPYFGLSRDITILYDQSYEGGAPGAGRLRPLLWLEYGGAHGIGRPVTVNLKRLFKGERPADPTLRITYYPGEDNAPVDVPVTVDPVTLRATLTPPGAGQYLIEWQAAPSGASGAADGIAATAATVEPDLPQGWTPTYHAPTVSDFTGSVSYQVPLMTPPGAAGLQPNLALTYSSGNGNGMIGKLQADEAGFGWANAALIDVTQALKTCHGASTCEVEADQDGDPDTYDPYNQYTLSFNGAGYELVHAAGKGSNGLPGRYYARGHAGLYVEYCSKSNGRTLSDFCEFGGISPAGRTLGFWRIKSPDNTSYRLGYNADAEQEIFSDHSLVNVDNPALRWRVDEVKDRFGNAMTYTYTERDYQYLIPSQYVHAPASYVSTIAYNGYTVIFDYLQLPDAAYLHQGYGYTVSWQVLYLNQVTIKAGTQLLRRYQLEHDFQRYGYQEDTADPIPNQSDWCAEYNWTLDDNGTTTPNDDVVIRPNSMPLLTRIDEFGRDGATSQSSRHEREFSYTFLGTGQVDINGITPHVHYCFPYLDSLETLYGPAGDGTPTAAFTWKSAQETYQATADFPDMSNGAILNRWVNVVEAQTTYSGHTTNSANGYLNFAYSNPNRQGDENVFQGFTTVSRCYSAVCAGAYVRKETTTFLAHPFASNETGLTGRASRTDVFGPGGVLMARTDNTWALLDEEAPIGPNDPDPALHAILTKQVATDYRGTDVSNRTDFEYDRYANQTEVREFGGGTTTLRTLERKYLAAVDAPNDKWLVNLVWRETLWDGLPNESDATKIVRRTRTRYDGASCSDPDMTPTQGLLKAEDRYLDSGGNSSCGANWLTTTYAYDGTGGGDGLWWQLTRTVDPGGRWRNVDWLDASRISSVADAIGTTSYTYNAYFPWLVKQVTQPNGAKTEYNFDIHARLDLIKTPNPATGALGGAHNDYAYFDDANPFAVDEVVSDAGNITTRTFYDALGRALQTRRWNINSDLGAADVVTDTKYDSLGRTTCVTAPYLDTTDRQLYTGTPDCLTLPNQDFVYDALGEQIKSFAYNGAETNTAVDGRKRIVTEPLSKVTTYENDALGRLVKVIEPSGGATMDYAYDLADNLTGVSGPNGATTTMTYDKLGRKLSMDDPDMGLWSYGYNPSGDLERQTDANTQRLCFYYDLAGRLTTKRHNGTGPADCPATPGGTVLANYTYHTTGGDKGLLKTVKNNKTGDAKSEDTYDYDFRGRVVLLTRVIGAKTYSRSTGYDLLDRPTSMGFVAGELVMIGYDGEYPKSISGIDAMVEDLTFNERGQLGYIDRPGTNMDTALGYYNDTKNFQLAMIQHGSSGGNLPDFGYNEYDTLGRLIEIVMTQFSNIETQTFGYDAVGRLTSAKATGTPAGANYDYTYTYGSGGNLSTRLDRTPNPDVTWTYAYDTPNHYHAVKTITGDATPTSFGYDANGNMTSRTVNNVSYTQIFDVENRLKSVTVNGQTTTFYYDADGNRILTVNDDGTTITKTYTPFPEYEETVVGTTSTQRRHYYLAGQLIAVRVRTGTTGTGTLSFAFNDHLGSVAAWANSTGVYIGDSSSRHEPYGGYRVKPVAAINPSISDRGFTGHKQNNTGTYDLGLIYMNARYYLPGIGRFISADSIVPDPKVPQSHNRYSYTRNNPVNLTDPTGHMETDGCDVDFDGCLVTPEERRASIAQYGRLLMENMSETTTDVDILAEIMDYAAEFGTSTKAWANDLATVINGATGPFTLFLSNRRDAALVFKDQGFERIYQDDQNQVYHWWAYVNTAVQGGPVWGQQVGKPVNDFHEFWDPTAFTYFGKRGASWEDYSLSLNGLAFGTALHNGMITPSDASDAMRLALNTDVRGPFLKWLDDNVPNSWLLPNWFEPGLISGFLKR